MSDEDPTPDPDQPDPPQPDPDAPEATDPPDAPEAPKPDELPPGVQAKLSKANREAANLRQRLKELEPLAAKAKELEQANQSDLERATNERDSHKSRADKAESVVKRWDVAAANAPEHATFAQVKAVAKRLQGDTDDDLEADAAELFELLAPKPADPPARVPARPAERMPRGGGDPDEPPEETDPKKLAALIPRGR